MQEENIQSMRDMKRWKFRKLLPN